MKFNKSLARAMLLEVPPPPSPSPHSFRNGCSGDFRSKRLHNSSGSLQPPVQKNWGSFHFSGTLCLTPFNVQNIFPASQGCPLPKNCASFSFFANTLYKTKTCALRELCIEAYFFLHQSWFCNIWHDLCNLLKLHAHNNIFILHTDKLILLIILSLTLLTS